MLIQILELYILKKICSSLKNKLFLVVVIGIVYTFAGDALKSVLENREQTIRMNIEEAEKRAQEAESKLLEAQIKFEDSRFKAVQIHKNSLTTAKNEVDQYNAQALEDMDRLYSVKDETILFQKQKIIKEISKQVIDSAFEKVYKKLENRYDEQFQNSVNNFYIALFRNYKP